VYASSDVVPQDRETPPTLVVAGCDPAVTLLDEALRRRGVRLVTISRSSGKALEMLRAGLVHVAGVHLAGSARSGNVAAVREQLGAGFALARWASWETGVATSPNIRLTSLDPKHLTKLHWIGRDPGSGAQRCLDQLFRGQRKPRIDVTAASHWEVTQGIRLGVANAGVCVRIVADEAHLDFRKVHSEPYDLCFRRDQSTDPVLAALLSALQADELQRLLSEVPGYRTHAMGEVAHVR
jgi:molybdate-binding protein